LLTLTLVQVFAARTKGPFFSRAPGNFLIIAFVVATGASTLFSLYWPFPQQCADGKYCCRPALGVTYDDASKYDTGHYTCPNQAQYDDIRTDGVTAMCLVDKTTGYPTNLNKTKAHGISPNGTANKWECIPSYGSGLIPLDSQHVGLVWLYCLAWFLLQDFSKVLLVVGLESAYPQEDMIQTVDALLRQFTRDNLKLLQMAENSGELSSKLESRLGELKTPAATPSQSFSGATGGGGRGPPSFIERGSINGRGSVNALNSIN